MKTVDQCECIRGRIVAGIFQMNELCMFSFLDFAEEFKVDVYFPFDEVYRQMLENLNDHFFTGQHMVTHEHSSRGSFAK